MHDVTTGQLALLIVAIALFAVGAILSYARVAWEKRPAASSPPAPKPQGFRIAAKGSQYLGLVAALGVVVWHAAARRSWLPLEDNFDALMWLGLLLTGFVLYTQRAHPLRGLDWFILPVVIVLFVAAAVFGKTKPHTYVTSVWSWVHRVSAYGGALAFVVAGAGGAMYLLVNRRLRAKVVGPNLGSLERLEHLTFTAVTLGFPLLTIAMITGLSRWFGADRTPPAYKVTLAVSAWLVYAIVLHSPINPSFRGKKTAILSVFGLFLTIGTLVAVQFVPEAR